MNFVPKRPGKRLGAWLGAVAAVGLSVLLFRSSQAVVEGFTYGARLCVRSVLPALFPFFVICNLLLSNPVTVVLGRPLRPLVRFWGLKSESAPLALLLSWLGGYAVCAQTVARMRGSGQLSKREATLTLLLGCCSGPGFVISYMGGILLGSVRTGVLLYALQIAANLLATACILPFLKVEKAESAVEDMPGIVKNTGLSGAISGAVDSSLQVCGCTLFFCVLVSTVHPFLPQTPWTRPMLGALLEISTGTAACAALGGWWALYGLCFCLSFPGISVLCQIETLLDGAVSLRPLLLSRLLHIVWMQGLMRLCARFLPGIAQVFSSLSERVIPMQRLPADAALICLLFVCCTLYKLHQTIYNRH